MDYFFVANQMGGKISGPFKTYEAAQADASNQPKEMRPTSIQKMIFCDDVNGAPCPECLRVSQHGIDNGLQSIEAMKKVAPKELHQ